MRKRFYIFGILIIAVGLGFVFSRSYQAAALDAPHNLENGLAPVLNANYCGSTCHVLHNAPGSQLNQQSGNVSLCVHCHTTGNTFVLPGSNPTVPGVVGIHHQYSVPTYPSPNSPADMFPGEHVLENGNIICSSCHDVHVATTNWGTQKVYPIAKVAGGGTGTVTLGSPLAANATAKAYRIKILVGGTVPTATFILSNDGGLSWWYWAAGAWTTTPGNGKPTGTNVDLNDGTNVKVTFTGDFSAGPPAADEFQFYVSYPFLRRALDYGPNGAQNPPTTNNLCRGCHSNRVNTYTQVEGPGDGTTKFNHPVGQKLNANSRGYDRATPLDANGAPQTSPPSADVDGNPSNDIRLDNSDSLNPKVQCYSCHNIHFGDSNSLSTDSPM